MPLIRFSETTPDPDDTWADDVLDRKEFAEYLTSLVESSATPLSVSINSEWGTGKSFFLRRWAMGLSKAHPVVVFNAWQADHRADPLDALLAELNFQLSQFRGIQKKAQKRLREKSIALLKVATPFTLKVMGRLLLGSEAVKEITELRSEIQGDLAEGAEEAAELAIESYSSQREAIENLKDALTELVRASEESAKSGIDGPLVFVIDELDRCRPPFAVGILEKVKHILSTQGVVFIIATDLTQLGHSIRGLYGESFDSQTYLRRFFDHYLRLPIPKTKRFVQMLSARHRLPIAESADVRVFYTEYKGMEKETVISAIFDRYKMTLRDAEQGYSRLFAAILALRGYDVLLEFMCNLVAIQIVALPQYERLLQKMVTPLEFWHNICEDFGFSADNETEAMRLHFFALQNPKAAYNAPSSLGAESGMTPPREILTRDVLSCITLNSRVLLENYRTVNFALEISNSDELFKTD